MAGIKNVKLKPPKSRASTEDLLVKLLAAIRGTYPADQTAAGLVLSDLPGGTQYGSICRYPNGGKVVVHQSRQATTREVLIDLARMLVGPELDTARAALVKAVK